MIIKKIIAVFAMVSFGAMASAQTINEKVEAFQSTLEESFGTAYSDSLYDYATNEVLVGTPVRLQEHKDTIGWTVDGTYYADYTYNDAIEQLGSNVTGFLNEGAYYRYQKNGSGTKHRFKIVDANGNDVSNWVTAGSIKEVLVEWTEEVYEVGFQHGYENGFSNGYAVGYSDGFVDGYASGYAKGFADGLSY